MTMIKIVFMYGEGKEDHRMWERIKDIGQVHPLG